MRLQKLIVDSLNSAGVNVSERLLNSLAVSIPVHAYMSAVSGIGACYVPLIPQYCLLLSPYEQFVIFSI